MHRFVAGRFIRVCLAALIFGVGIFMTPLSVLAEGEGLVVSPPFQHVTLEQNSSSHNVEFTLTNRTKEDQSIVLTSIDFKSLDETGGVAFLGQDASSLERKYGLADWIKLPGSSIKLAAGSSQKVVVIIQNRSDLSPGGHYGAVLFRVLAEGAKAENSIAIKQVFASLIFAKKLGGERYDLKLDGIDMPRKWVTANQDISLRFRNDGNVHVVPRGTVELLSAGGKQISKANINVESGLLLPSSMRKYTAKLSGGGALKPGRYQLSVSYRYDGSDRLQTHREAIYIFDMWFAVAVGVFSLGLATLAFFAARYFWLRRAKKLP